MINLNDIKKLEAEINAAIDEAIKTNGKPESPAVDALISEYTGPATNLCWNMAARKLSIANGCTIDESGNVVNPKDVTGPATGLEYRDGHVVKIR